MSEIYSPGSIPGPPATFLGAYNAATSYSTGDAVGSGGSSYVSLVNANSGNPPATSPTQWGLLAAAGATGATGEVSGVALATFAARLSSQNLFNAATITPGSGIATADGSVFTSSDVYCSDYFPVVPGGHIVCNVNIGYGSNPAGLAFYDIHQSFLSAQTALYPLPAGTPVAVPANAVYARMTSQTAYGAASTVMVVSGTVLPSAYTPWGSSIATATHLAATDATATALAATVATKAAQANIATVLASAFPAVNLFNAAATSQGLIGTIDGTPTFTTVSDFFYSDYFPVQPGGNLITNGDTGFGSNPVGFAFYDADKIFVGASAGVPHNTAVGVPSNAVFARVGFSSGNETGVTPIQPGAVMIVNGTVLPATYSPWRADPTLYSGLTANNAAVASLAATVAGAYPLAGKKWMPFGDSITAILSGVYQQSAMAITGLTIPYQDAHGGRQTPAIFENYGNNPATGIGLGGIIPGYGATPVENLKDSSGVYAWAPAGRTLAADLAQIDIVTVYLGSNDAGPAADIGALGDAIGSGSYYGYLRAAIEGLQNAKPSLRILWITPAYNSDSGSSTAAIVTAIQTICAAYGIPVLDLYHSSGVNALNLSTHTADGVHPQAELSVRIGKMLGNRMIDISF